MSTKTDDISKVGLHKFELAGLGKAPFHYVGMFEKTYQACVGAPVQPGGTCDYCGNGIRYVFMVHSADGKAFGVGCDCIAKVGDEGLMKAYKTSKEFRAIQKQKRDTKAAKEMEELTMVLETHRDALLALPHPSEWRASKGETALDHASWMLRNAGASGRGSTLRWVKRQLSKA